MYDERLEGVEFEVADVLRIAAEVELTVNDSAKSTYLQHNEALCLAFRQASVTTKSVHCSITRCCVRCTVHIFFRPDATRPVLS